MSKQSFYPPKRILMGPGPSDVYPRVLEALSRPTIGHLDPAFICMMDDVKDLLQSAFQTKNSLTIPVSAPGSAGMEACFTNLVEPGDKVLVCINGVFGHRMKENVLRAGGIPIVVDDPWGRSVNLQKVEDALVKNPNLSILAFVHAETSTGALSDAKSLCNLAKKHGCLTIVDAVTSFGGVELNVDEWGIDAVYSGSQKCLSCIPGLSPVSFSDAAVERMKSRKSRVNSWFLDMNLVMGYWGGNGKRAYHHTAPVNQLYALHESLCILLTEGLKSSWSRHRENHKALVTGFAAMGITLFVPDNERLPQLNTINIPAEIDDVQLRSLLLTDYNLEIGAGLGELAGKVCRVGLMGFSANKSNVLICLGAIGSTLNKLGMSINVGDAIEAATDVYDNTYH